MTETAPLLELSGIDKSFGAVHANRDVSLTLRLDLQNDLYALLEEMIPTLAKDSPGGAIVVLHVPTREVLALVSYPGFDANEFNTR